jgi:hypothetical protein
MTTTIATLTPHEAQACTMASFNASAHDLQPGLPSNPVYVLYWTHAWNPRYQRHEALFMCYRTESMTLNEGDFLGHWYEGALENFKQ